MFERLRKHLSLGDVFLTIGLLLIAAALFWAMGNIREDRHAGAASEETLSQLLSRTQQEQIVQNAMDAAQEDDEVFNELDIPDYLLNPDLEMPVTEIAGKKYLGFLSIPSLDLELPVSAELNREMLRIAPCYYTGSVYSDNMVIAAHNYRRHFGLIGSMNEGDLVIFTDTEGHIFQYKVNRVEILDAYEVDRMVDSEFALTLFTCTIGGKNRVTVRCVKDEEVQTGLLPTQQQ